MGDGVRGFDQDNPALKHPGESGLSMSCVCEGESRKPRKDLPVGGAVEQPQNLPHRTAPVPSKV